MSKQDVKFNMKDRPEFTKELRSRVDAYFKEKNISKFANTHMKIKTAFMLALYFVPFILMLTGVVSSYWGIMGLWAIMGIGMASIGVCVMHDGNHGAYSKNPKVNRFMGFILNFMGGYHLNWKIQHNVLHHAYTNIQDHDEDLDSPLLRLSPDGPQHPAYAYQAFYAPFAYSLLAIYWVLGKDFDQLVRYNKLGLLQTQRITFNKALGQIIFNKVWYLILTLGLPLYLVQQPVSTTILGFLLMGVICSLELAFVFMLAHVVEEIEYFTKDENGSVENNWAIHQLRTTANFANDSKLLSWFIGGLNYQIEHHLFPTICHIHYRGIAPIVQKTAEEYGVPYHIQKTFWGAIKSHFSLLHKLGRGKAPATS